MARPKGSTNRPRAPRTMNIDPDVSAPAPERQAAAPLTRRAPRAAPRTEAREIERSPVRRGANVVIGRNGEQLTRRRNDRGDVFDLPRSEIPQGWDYQWNAVSVAGSSDATRETELDMYANGWRPVPASRHPGRWTAPGFEGEIVVKGLRLEERPIELTKEARVEDIARAKAQMSDQQEALGLQKKLPQGFAASNRYRGTGADVRLSIDKGLDIPTPDHQLAGDE